MIHFGDITKLSGYDLPIVDVITGGSPCQDLSVAGKRAGLAGERSGLFMEQIRIVKEMRERSKQDGRADEFIQPRYMVWENVPGAFSSNGGRDFQAVLTEIVRVVCPEAPDVPLPENGGKWPKAGCLFGVGDNGQPFSIAYRVHNAQFWGVAQRRKRLCIVSDFGGCTASEICFERQSMRWDSEPCREKREALAGTARESIKEASTDRRVRTLNSGDVQSKQIFDPKGVVNTLCSGTHEGKNIAPSVLARKDVKAYGISSMQLKGMLSDNPNVGFYETEISKTIDLNGGNPACNQGGICVAYGFEPGAAKRLDTENVCVDLTYQDKTGSLMASGYEKLGTQEAANDMFVANTIVRRLTPEECEALQGFPRGWTDIGEWTDSSGKKHKPSDTPRYRALGNSIAVGYANNQSGFWMYIMKRISAQYERRATLGSLFDGIGGFPLAWETYNGKGSAIWASEIEPFCIAVTKKHFPEEGEDT